MPNDGEPPRASIVTFGRRSLFGAAALAMVSVSVRTLSHSCSRNPCASNNARMRGVFHCAEQSVQTARLIEVRHRGVPVRDLGSSLATFLSIFTVVLS